MIERTGGMSMNTTQRIAEFQAAGA